MIDRRKTKRREYDDFGLKLEVIENYIVGNLENETEGIFSIIKSLAKRVSAHEVLLLIFLTSLVGMVFCK